jgi:hypothetical protein
MQLATPLVFLLSFTLTTSLPLTLSPRDISTFLSDISTISSDVSTLTGDVNAYNGSFVQTLGLINTFDNLKSATFAAASEVTGIPDFSSADSSSAIYATTTLIASVTALLSDLDAKVMRLPAMIFLW